MDVVVVTKGGMVKRTSADEFRVQSRGGGGVTAMSVAEGDEVVAIAPVAPKAKSVMVVTKSGIAIQFPIDDVRSMSRTAQGTRAIRLQDDDEVVGVVVL
jgi:DNA gyrase subunit A